MQSRAGAQIPFSSINYGMDTSPEGRIVIKNLLLATESGIGDSANPMFPIQIFKVKEGINYNPKDPNYDLFQLACKVSAKRIYPNFAFVDAPFNLKYYIPGHSETETAYMGCGTRVIENINDPSKQIVNGRGNLSCTTVNLVKIALRSNKNINMFFEELDKKIDIVINQMLERYEIQAKKRVKNFPFLMGQGIWMDSDSLSWEDEIREVLKHGTLSMGFIGLAECLKSLTDKHHEESEESQNLGLEIIGFMRNRMDEASRKYNLNFVLLSTSDEDVSRLLVSIDRKIFGIVEGVTDVENYTNGFQIPKYYPIGVFDKIQAEAPYHELTNAGHITSVEFEYGLNNLEDFEGIVRAMKESGIGYGAINESGIKE
jgi:ribonucleoside-triphosphate reductase